MRHRFVNLVTGEVLRVRCDNWRCQYCGPRKVDMWRQLVKVAEPTLFVTLTKVGWTLKGAVRVYTTVLEYQRRGSKGRGSDHVGAPPAYPIECFTVLEEHSDFENVGFHWHMLVKGADYLPKQVVSDALRSATKGCSYVVHVERVRKTQAVGYVTKYLMKEVTQAKRGMREEQREMTALGLDENGYLVKEHFMQTVQVVSKARRIRYTRHFFPESTAELRLKLFSQLEGANDIVIDEAASPGDAFPEDEAQADSRSSWSLYEQEPFSDDIRDYRERRRKAFMESLIELRGGKPMYSRRVVNIWAYQRGVLRSYERRVAR